MHDSLITVILQIVKTYKSLSHSLGNLRLEKNINLILKVSVAARKGNLIHPFQYYPVSFYNILKYFSKHFFSFPTVVGTELRKHYKNLHRHKGFQRLEVSRHSHSWLSINSFLCWQNPTKQTKTKAKTFPTTTKRVYLLCI